MPTVTGGPEGGDLFWLSQIVHAQCTLKSKACSVHKSLFADRGRNGGKEGGREGGRRKTSYGQFSSLT